MNIFEGFEVQAKLQLTSQKNVLGILSSVDGSHNFAYFSRNFQGGNRKLLA